MLELTKNSPSISETKDLSLSKPSRFSFRVIRYLAIYSVAYSIHPLLIEALKYNGAASSSTFLFLVPHYLAMVLFGLLSFQSLSLLKNLKWNEWKKASFVGMLDILHQFFEKTGLVFVGSAIYIIIGNSSIVWTALVSFFILKKTLNRLQWVSLCIVCSGLGIKASFMDFQLGNYLSIGVIFTLISAFLHSVSTVINEKYITGPESIPGPTIVFMTGVVNLTILLIWSCVWTIPRWDDVVTKNIIKHNGNVLHIAIFMVGLFVCSYIHCSTLWYLLKVIGSVSYGVLKGIKAVVVFLLAHYFFCHIQESQCLTVIKVLSATICVFGVLMYTLVTVKEPGEQNEKFQQKIPQKEA